MFVYRIIPVKLAGEMSCHKCARHLHTNNEAWSLGAARAPDETRELIFCSQGCLQQWVSTHPVQDYFAGWYGLVDTVLNNLKENYGKEFNLKTKEME